MEKQLEQLKNSGELIVRQDPDRWVNPDTEILKLQKIDCLVKALGTMVMIPKYDSDPNQIGVKHFAGTIQQPILLDDIRETALTKINDIIKSL